jgi:hypothetical protein
MIDRELVTRKLLLVQQDLDALAPYARKPLSEYLVSPTDELVVERLLERSIGRLIDALLRAPACAIASRTSTT